MEFVRKMNDGQEVIPLEEEENKTSKKKIFEMTNTFG